MAMYFYQISKFRSNISSASQGGKVSEARNRQKQAASWLSSDELSLSLASHGFMFGSFSNPEDGVNTLIRKVDEILRDYMTAYFRYITLLCSVS
jgi:hypothetical protein